MGLLSAVWIEASQSEACTRRHPCFRRLNVVLKAHFDGDKPLTG